MKGIARWAAAATLVVATPALAQDTGNGSYSNAVSVGVFIGWIDSYRRIR